MSDTEEIAEEEMSEEEKAMMSEWENMADEDAAADDAAADDAAADATPSFDAADDFDIVFLISPSLARQKYRDCTCPFGIHFSENGTGLPH